MGKSLGCLCSQGDADAAEFATATPLLQAVFRRPQRRSDAAVTLLRPPRFANTPRAPRTSGST